MGGVGGRKNDSWRKHDEAVEVVGVVGCALP